jgi:SAM-dependent methyltransferase
VAEPAGRGAAPPYGRLVRWRRECSERFGGIFDLPIAASFYAEARARYSGGRVLDVGAGLEKALRRELALREEDYACLDADPDGAFDYAAPEQIPQGERFALIALSQVLEHVPVEGAFALVAGVGARLAPGGQLLIGVPNAQHPVRQWGDATHVTSWPYEDLYGLVREAGLGVVRIARYGKPAPSRNPVERLLVRAVARGFRMDWCDSILLVAARAAG